MKNLDDVKIKQSILNFLDQLKEKTENEENIEEITENTEVPVVAEETPKIQLQPPIEQKIQPELSDHIFEEYIGSAKKTVPPKQQAPVLSIPTPVISQAPKEKRSAKKPIVEKKEVVVESNQILTTLKENTRKLEDLTNQVDMASNCKFKFDIRRDNNGFISSVIVEKIKE